MRTSFFLAAAACGSVVFAGCSSSTCEELQTCGSSLDAGAEGSALDGEVQTDGGVDALPPVDGAPCDTSQEPKDAPACVADGFGVFVSATGDDGNAGTKASPVKTIGAALGKGKSRVYVCEGTYAEHVAITSGVGVYGGFGCGDWKYTGNKAKVEPGDAGYALKVTSAGSAVVVVDLALTAQAGTSAAVNSVGVFVSKSSGVRFRRVKVKAGAGYDAANAAAPGTNLFSANIADLQGSGAIGATGGVALVCACKGYGTSTGGKGGNAGANAENGGAGVATPMPTAMAGFRDGLGGLGNPQGAPGCKVGHDAADGVARNGGAGASSLGLLDETGWTPKDGASGEAGNPGGGGGGGGGGLAGGSGGGGCGGCGGAGGLGGGGGGASIAVIAFNTPVTVEASELVSSQAGQGGNGSTGEGGGGGGGGGNVGACGGGQGGNGAGGSGGGGGAGGVSAGIGYVGAAPTVDVATTTTLGAAGAAGALGGAGPGGTNTLGTAASGAPGTAGRAGVSAAVQSLAP